MGARYRLDGTEDLVNGPWSVLIANIDGTGEILKVSDPDAARFRQYFYRLVRIPTSPTPASGFASGLDGELNSPTWGFLNLTIPAKSKAAVGTPFLRETMGSGEVGAVSQASLSDPSAHWHPRRWTTVPNAVQLVSGKSAGRSFLIDSHSENTLTLDPEGTSLASLVAPGDKYVIRPMNTLGSLFGTTKVPMKSGATVAAADQVRLWNGRQYEVYFHNGVNWRLLGAKAVQDDTPVYPGEGMLISNSSTKPLSLFFSGQVPDGVQSVQLPAKGLALMTSPFPWEIPLQSSGLDTVPGWKSGKRGTTADEILLWDHRLFRSFFFDGFHWRMVGTPAVQDDKKIELGSSFFIRRGVLPPRQEAIWLQSPAP
jgi:uncharacterized protein (TIGR02597 family)